jgi:hypothetical protein
MDSAWTLPSAVMGIFVPKCACQLTLLFVSCADYNFIFHLVGVALAVTVFLSLLRGSLEDAEMKFR